MVTAHFFPNCKDLILQIYMRRRATKTESKRENRASHWERIEYRRLASGYKLYRRMYHITLQ